MRQILVIAIGILLSIVLLGVVLSRIDAARFLQSLAEVHYGYVFLSSAIFVLAFYLRAVRWRELLYDHRGAETGPFLSAMSIGFMANNLFPVRFGELLRAWFLGWKKRISKSFVFSTVLVERALDFFVLIIFLLLALPHVPLPPALERTIYGLFGAGGILGVMMLAFHFSRGGHARWLRSLSRIFPEKYSGKISTVADSLLRGLVVYHHPLHFLNVLFLSFLLWILWGVGFVLALKGFDLSIPLPGVLLAAAVVNLGLVLPSSPGYVGTYQFLCVFVLGLMGIETSRAFGFSIVFHAVWYLPYTAIGIWYLWRENLSLSYLWKAGKGMAAGVPHENVSVRR